MRELFLTATVPASDFDVACAIFQGLTWMTARQTAYRILYFAGQPVPKGLPNMRNLRMTPLAPLWNELSRQLSRSSYVLQTRYEVSPTADFGKDTGMDFNNSKGTLLWTDLPDPLRDTPIISRKKVEIPDQTFLPTILADNSHTYTSELIQQSYSFVRENVEFVFSRYYHLPESPGRPVPVLPAWKDLRPADPAQKWVLNVKLNVPDDSQPEKIRKANDELMAVKAELEKLFDFKIIDRRVFDTRITPPKVVTMPAPP
ncbi:mediator complex, subunit Med18 [Biscogniauxia mediterranea]|nr:mediator complex, subunit Med18 [Biscogniauxia mediterranea]